MNEKKGSQTTSFFSGGNMDNQKIKIKTEGGYTKVYVGDTQIKGVREIKFHQSVETAPTIQIEVLALDTEFEVDGVKVDLLKKE